MFIPASVTAPTQPRPSPTLTPTPIPSPTSTPTPLPTSTPRPTPRPSPSVVSTKEGPKTGQSVTIDSGTFTVNVISANLNDTKVVVDTASDSDCANNCPVKSLAEFAQRRGAIAAINGPYFCPGSYPACAGKTNSFDTLLMNLNKTYFNSNNNVYSQNPVAIFSATSRFVAAGQEWGRDTSVDSVIMSRPLLVFNNEVKFFGNGDSKETEKVSRAFIGATGSTVYIGVVYTASVADMAKVLQKMGIQNALNLDSSGSLAFWANGRYLAGPGRNTPFGILLVKR